MGWEAAVIAISTAIMAAFVLVSGLVGLVLFRDLRRAIGAVEKAITGLNEDVRPALLSARDIVEDAGKVVKSLKDEAGEIATSSRKVRKKITRAAESIEERLIDLDALVDVAQMELEDTVLDVAAALRTGRRGARVLRAFKRALTGRRR